MKQFFNSIRIALSNVRKRFFHTLLSILGIVIGVAALVGILSLIDGMEEYARGQISQTTSLEMLSISTNRYKKVNNLRVKKDDYGYLNTDQFIRLMDNLEDSTAGMMQNKGTEELSFYDGTDSIQAASETMGYLAINAAKLLEGVELTGRNINKTDVIGQKQVCIVNAQLAKLLTKEAPNESLIGKTIRTKIGDLEVVGVGKKLREGAAARLAFPLSLLSDQQLKQNPPSCTLVASDVREVNAVKEATEKWLAAEFPEQHEDFAISTNGARVKQAEQAFLVFRLVMGFIVGLSVLVGGIGVMNVMLISINERTTEIGICKAMGAKRKDIFIQYLSESVTISGLGSVLGLVFGILGTFVVVPIIKNVAKIPFEAAYTFNTLLVIGIVALLVGVVFGTYPAIRASKLNPVEAMRRE